MTVWIIVNFKLISKLYFSEPNSISRRIVNWQMSRPKGRTAVWLNISFPAGSTFHKEKGSSSVEGSYPAAKWSVSPRPWPNSMLSTGPAIVPVIAISANPFFVIAISALQSPSELPHAITVRPKRALGSPVTNPHSYKRSIIVSDINLIHAMLIINARNAKIIISHSGGLVFFTLILINIPMIEPGIMLYKPIFKKVYVSVSSSNNYEFSHKKASVIVIGVIAALFLSQSSSPDGGIV